jgi:hypothetical protein
MPSDLPRINFNRSRLTCLLTDLALVDADEPGAAFAERWGHWLGVADAIALSAALAGGRTIPAEPTSLQPEQSLRTACEDIRYSLELSIRSSCAPNGTGRNKLPPPDTNDFLPYQRYYQAHQRDMELAIRPLRARVRAVLMSSLPALKQLAVLDQLFDDTLSSRESRLLASVPVLLEKHFTCLRQDAANQVNDDAPPYAWRTAFGQKLQAALLAELELRLLPVVGLIEAFEHAGLPAQNYFRK